MVSKLCFVYGLYICIISSNYLFIDKYRLLFSAVVDSFYLSLRHRMYMFVGHWLYSRSCGVFKHNFFCLLLCSQQFSLQFFLNRFNTFLQCSVLVLKTISTAVQTQNDLNQTVQLYCKMKHCNFF